MEIEQGSVVRCVVDRISGTTVFVSIDGEKRPGTIILSEISPGRIRNLRNFVVPKKTIVCKVLRIAPDHIELSLRRTTQKEQKEVLSRYKTERSYESVLKTILGHEEAGKIIEKVREENNLYDFFESQKESPKELEKLIGKENAKKVIEIIKSQKSKSVEVKKEISLKSTDPKGVELIKELLSPKENIKITYLGSGRYSLKTEAEDAKKADNKLREFIEEIEKKCKEKDIEFTKK